MKPERVQDDKEKYDDDHLKDAKAREQVVRKRILDEKNQHMIGYIDQRLLCHSIRECG